MNKQQAWYHRNIDAERQRGRDKYYRTAGTPEGSALNLIRGAKQRAAKKGIPFDLTKEWALERIQTGLCEVTGIPFEFGSTPRLAFGPTIDRIVPSKGYAQDNCQIVVWAYNAAKGCGTHNDVIRLVRALS